MDGVIMLGFGLGNVRPKHLGDTALNPTYELVDIKGIRLGHYLVTTKRITFFHRIYGWVYSNNPYPSFVIRRDITERDKLISEIKQHIRMPA